MPNPVDLEIPFTIIQFKQSLGDCKGDVKGRAALPASIAGMLLLKNGSSAGTRAKQSGKP